MPFENLPTLPLTIWLLLATGLATGIAVLLVIRSQQVQRDWQSSGRSFYEADRLRRRLLHWAGWSTVGVLVVAGIYYFWRFTPGDTAPEAVPPAPTVTQSDPLAGMRLLIPRMGIEADVIEAPIIAHRWDISLLRDEVAHLEGTAYPGQPGNAALVGHITIPGAGWGPFQELEILQTGDLVFIEQEDQMFVYEVFDNFTVDSIDVHVVFPTEDNRLTLLTCTGWDDAMETYTQRIVVVAWLLP